MTCSPKSLKQTLFVWLILPLVVLVLVNAFFSYKNAIDVANDAYDRSLYIAARTIGEELKLVDGKLNTEAPHSASYLFENNIGSRFFFEVINFDGKRLFGNAILPSERESSTNRVNYYALVSFNDELINEQPIRLAILKHPVIESGHIKNGSRVSELVTIKVGETLEARELLISKTLRSLLTGQAMLLVAMTALIWLVIYNSFKPIAGLSRSLVERSESDLTTINAESLPKELIPLIDSLNIYISRLTNLIHLRKIFIGNAAHQLRTPWTIVKTQIGLAKKEPMTDELRKIIQGLSRTADASVRLTEQLLSMTKAEHGYEIDMTKDVDLVPLVKRLVIDHCFEAQKLDIDLGADIRVPSLTINGSEILLSECIANLIDNAIRYTQPGGRVTVVVDLRSVSVIDNGPGIPLQHHNRVFNRFFRGDSNQPGSGLGLSIVKEIALQHNMEVVLESPYTFDSMNYMTGTKISLVVRALQK
jgi:two-component system sensor histidine kinase TctE